MIEMLRIYSKGFLENVTIEELSAWPLPWPLLVCTQGFGKKSRKGRVVK
jgi:hypothetical protein